MADYVQVPVSLVERALAVASRRGYDLLANDLRALLSQPTAAPPRIDDMAPGTTFTATIGSSDIRHRFERLANRHAPYTVRDLFSGQLWKPSAIDPPTIRDVTPPKDAA